MFLDHSTCKGLPSAISFFSCPTEVSYTTQSLYVEWSHCSIASRSGWVTLIDNYRQHISSNEGPFQLPHLSAISEDVREEVSELVTLCLEVLVMEEEKVMEYVSHYSLLLDIPRSVAAIANMSKLSIMAACWRVLATTSEGKETAVTA